MGLVLLLFLVVPFVELFVIIEVGQAIGAPSTIVLLVAISVVGAWLVKREGLGTLRRAQARMGAGQVPGAERMDGLLILFAGALLLTPGFLTDGLGICLLVPPVRAGIRRALGRFFGGRTGAAVIRRYR